ncbi:hypothetical protein D3C87_256860 [compost metagenome]
MGHPLDPWFPELDARERELGVTQLSECSHCGRAAISLSTTALRGQFAVRSIYELGLNEIFFAV